MEKALEIAFVDLSVPLWHIIVYAALLSFFMLTWRMKAFFATTILFILYWGYLFRPHFLATVGTGFVPITAFALLGLALVGLLIYVFLFDVETEAGANYPSREVAHLRKSLLKRIDKMEKSLINEAQTQLKDENWKFESIQKEMEEKLLNFRAQLEEEGAGRRESEIREIQERLNGRIQELESQIRSKEELLAARDREKEDLRARSRASLDSLEARLREKEDLCVRSEAGLESLRAQLREKEEALEVRKTDVIGAEKRQIAKIDELESRLTAQLSQLVTRSGELEEIRSASEKRIAALEAELRQKTDDLNGSRDSVNELEESLKRKIQMLERQLEEKAESIQPSSAKDFSLEPLLPEYPSSWNIRDKIEALLEPEMERLWADLVERGMLSQEREREVQIIQQKMN